MDHDDLSPSARRVLSAARRADDPTAVDRRRIDAAFAARLRAFGISAPLSITSAPTSAPPPVDTASATAPATGSGVGVTGKLALALLGAGAVALGLTQLPHGDDGRQARSASSARPLAAIPQPLPPHVSTPSAVTPRVAAVAAQVPGRETPPSITARSEKHSASSPRRAREAARVESAPTPLNVDSLREEVALLETANNALRSGSYASALRALDAHQSRFAEGALREERLGLRVLALCGLGDYAAGNAARRSFLRDAPRSVLARKVLDACARGESVEPGRAP